MTINIDHLEKLAREATEAWPKQAVRLSVPGSVPTEVVNLWVTCTPSNVLALCKVARAAKVTVQNGHRTSCNIGAYGLDDPCDCGQAELEEALVELEARDG